MTREETKQLLLAIESIYPNFRPEDASLTVDTWHWMLEEYDGKAVKAALQIYVKTNNTGFAPSVSQLIGCMYKPIENEQLSEGEAWSLVKKAIQDGIYHSEERFNELPEVVQKAVGSANMIYQWAQTDSDEVNTVVMSNFQRTYRAVVQRQAFENKIPKQLADVVKGIAEKKPDKPLLNDFNNFEGRKYDYAQLEKEAFGE